MRRSLLLCLSTLGSLALLGSACDDAPTTPTASSMRLVLQTPPPGATIDLPAELIFFNPGGLVVPKDSGFISVRVDLTVGRPEALAQLTVFLLTSDVPSGYCGQNTPDWPVWESLPEGWTTTVTITGFRVFRLPCRVTGVRAILSRREGSLNPTPPLADTIVQATVPADFRLQQ